MALSPKKIITTTAEASRKPGNFFESLRKAETEPLDGSIFIKNDNTLDKYIFESAIPAFTYSVTSGPSGPYGSSSIFKPVLSPVKEVEETEELNDYGGGSRSSKIEVDEYLFIVIVFMHGGYPIDNTKTPITSITKRNAPLINPGNKFDGYESLTICGAAPPSQINVGIPNLLDEVYHPVVMGNLDRFSTLLTEKISSVEIQAPSPASAPFHEPRPTQPSKLHKSSSRSRSRSRSYKPRSISNFKKGGGGKKLKKSKSKFKEVQPTPATPATPAAITLVSSVPRSSIHSKASKFSRFPKLVSTIQKVSHGIKSRLFSLVKGCVKIVMDNFKVDYAVLNVSGESYNITQTNVVNAIICRSQHGALKINDDLFDAFSYNLFWGLRQHDQQYFYENCRDAISQAVPGSDSCIKRQYALANAYERFPCIRSIVKGGLYNAAHVEKTYSYHDVNDFGVGLGVRIYGYNMVSAKNDKREISVTSETRFIDIGLGEIFAGKSPDPNLGEYYGITLSEISLVISNKIDEEYFGGNSEKKRVSIIDISCSSFFQAQPSIPVIPEYIGIGGRSKQSIRNKTKRKNDRNERNERKGRSKSKIRNRRMSKRTRKNMKK